MVFLGIGWPEDGWKNSDGERIDRLRKVSKCSSRRHESADTVRQVFLPLMTVPLIVHDLSVEMFGT